ncbi:MAG: GGDEF domain-containing protein, partial [Candidatus Sericytochromatia bacterium]
MTPPGRNDGTVRGRGCVRTRPSAGARSVVVEVVEDLNIPHATSRVSPIVTVSIGVLAQKRPTSGSATADLECCDRLLYQAKQTGRNRIVVAEQ